MTDSAGWKATATHTVVLRVERIKRATSEVVLLEDTALRRRAAFLQDLSSRCTQAIKSLAVKEAILSTIFQGAPVSTVADLDRRAEAIRGKFESEASRDALLLISVEREVSLNANAHIDERFGARFGEGLLDQIALRAEDAPFIEAVLASVALKQGTAIRYKSLIDQVTLQDDKPGPLFTGEFRMGGAGVVVSAFNPDDWRNHHRVVEVLTKSEDLMSAVRVLIEAVQERHAPAVAFLLAFSSVEILVNTAFSRMRNDLIKHLKGAPQSAGQQKLWERLQSKLEPSATLEERFEWVLLDLGSVPSEAVLEEKKKFHNLKEQRDALAHRGSVAAAESLADEAIRFAQRHLALHVEARRNAGPESALR